MPGLRGETYTVPSVPGMNSLIVITGRGHLGPFEMGVGIAEAVEISISLIVFKTESASPQLVVRDHDSAASPLELNGVEGGKRAPRTNVHHAKSD